MSRDTKIKDTKRIITGFDEQESQYFLGAGSTEACIPLSRESIKHYADEACVEACELLYDLNIRTIFSGANVDGQENTDTNAFIGISYDALSEENKNIVKKMIAQGIIEPIINLSGRGEGNVVIISVLINSNDLVGDVSDKLMILASYFVEQDVLFGRTTEKEIRALYYQKENGNYYDYAALGELTKEELEKRIEEEVQLYFADDEGNLFFTEDLLNKHKLYREKLVRKLG